MKLDIVVFWANLEGIPAGAMAIYHKPESWGVYNDPPLATLIPPRTDRAGGDAQVGFDEQLSCILQIWRTIGNHRRFVLISDDGD